MLTFGSADGAVSGLNGLVAVQGPLATLSRRLVYALRMPTPQQQATALLSQGVSGLLTVAGEMLALRERQRSSSGSE